MPSATMSIGRPGGSAATLWIIAAAIFTSVGPYPGTFGTRRVVLSLRKGLTAVLGTCGEESHGPREGARTITAHGGEEALENLGLPTAQTARLP